MDKNEVLTCTRDCVQAISDALLVANDEWETNRPAFSKYRPDSYFMAHFFRMVVRGELERVGVETVRGIPNTGIEACVPGIARIKVLRSGPSGELPSARGRRRRDYCNSSQQVAVQEQIPPACDDDVSLFWDPFRPEKQSDGLAHLILDWSRPNEMMSLHLSEVDHTVGKMIVAKWRVEVDAVGSCNAFVPTDEEIKVFIDENDGQGAKLCLVNEY